MHLAHPAEKVRVAGSLHRLCEMSKHCNERIMISKTSATGRAGTRIELIDYTLTAFHRQWSRPTVYRWYGHVRADQMASVVDHTLDLVVAVGTDPGAVGMAN